MIITKRHSIVTMLLATLFLFTNCSKEEKILSSEELIKQHNLAGKYMAKITPKLMGSTPVTSGKHEVELINKGNGILQLKFSEFRAKPMPFEMSVNIKMRIKMKSDSELTVVNIGGDFDADLPKGTTVIDPKDTPNGIALPKEALKNGLHSEGKSTISGKYHIISIDGKPTGKMNFEWNIEPNIGLPVTVSVITLNKK